MRMQRRWMGASVVAVATLLAACERREDAPPADDTAVPAADTARAGGQPPAELQSAADQFTQSFNGSDPAAVAQHFAEDATVTVDGTTFNGRNEIESGWLQENVPAISNLQTHDTEAHAQGQDYRTTGRYTMDVTTPDGRSQASGRYETLWTRAADNRWRIRSMTVTSDQQLTS